MAPVVVALGGALMAAGAVGSSVERRGRRRVLEHALWHGDVATRRAAVEMMAARPAHYAETLLRRVAVERDAGVIDAIAGAAADRAHARDGESLVRLRLWALTRPRHSP